MKPLVVVGVALLFAAPAHAWPWGKHGSRAEAQTACIEWANAGGRERASSATLKPFTPEPFISRSKWDELNAGRDWGWKGRGDEDPSDFFYDLGKEQHERIQRLQAELRAEKLIRSCQLELDTRQFLGFEKGRKGVVRRFRY